MLLESGRPLHVAPPYMLPGSWLFFLGGMLNLESLADVSGNLEPAFDHLRKSFAEFRTFVQLFEGLQGARDAELPARSGIR